MQNDCVIALFQQPVYVKNDLNCTSMLVLAGKVALAAVVFSNLES